MISDWHLSFTYLASYETISTGPNFGTHGQNLPRSEKICSVVKKFATPVKILVTV